MKKLNEKQLELLEGGRFLGWGWRDDWVKPDFIESLPGCPCGGWEAHHTYTIFGIGAFQEDYNKCAKCT